MLGKNLIQAATGAAGGDGLGVEDVFSTWLYAGNNSTQTISNGIDLAGEGGLVWIKSRNNTFFYDLADTARGGLNRLSTNSDAAQATGFSDIAGFTSSGFNLTVTTGSGNSLGTNYASWTFRKAPKFFDMVTWTGDNASTRNISHALASTPGAIFVKATSTSQDWLVWHTSTGVNQLALNQVAAGGVYWYNNIKNVGSTTFEIDANINASGTTYVAYLFAHDAGGFGDSGDESVIKCGSFTVDSFNRINPVDLDFEPQFLLLKMSSASSQWYMYDIMRGLAVQNGAPPINLLANATSAETTESPANNNVSITADGFTQGAGYGGLSANSTGIYIAIRRGPMKTPTDATKVFSVRDQPPTPTNIGFVADTTISKWTDGVQSWFWRSRLTGQGNLYSDQTAAEGGGIAINWDSPTNTIDGGVGPFYVNYDLGRAPGFFDVVAYTGTGSTLNVNHNLGVAPELIITKNRSSGVTNWAAYSAALGNTQGLYPNAPNATSTLSWWNNTSPTSTVFTVTSADITVNQSGSGHIAYLFATCPGVSKVGSYTGTGTTLNIDCGFTSGARFVLIKRTDSTGDWYVYDSARGIVSGNDPYLLMNSDALEVTSTDYIDPLSSGFQITSTAPAAINASGGSYIFLAIA